MFYKESKNFLSKENIIFIENIILGNNFPFYLSQKSTATDNYKKMFHELLLRPEGCLLENRINSTYYNDVFNLVNSFLKKFKIKQKEILRMCINFTYNNGVEKCPVHKDHDFPHKQLIIYLNEADINSKTVILNEKNKIIKEIAPEKYKGVCFDNVLHYHYYPKKGERIILITTFR